MKEKYYLEIIEILTEEESLEKQPQIIRIEVESEEEAKKLLPQYEPLFAGKNYVKQLHICRHSLKGNKPCEVKSL